MGQAQKLFYAYRKRISALEDSNPNMLLGTVTRKLAPEREKLKENILKLAIAKGMTSGKVSWTLVTEIDVYMQLKPRQWMLFPQADDVPRAWKLICEAVVEDRLGPSAKVGTEGLKGRSNQRLICVYTRDFSDEEDIRRVVEELASMNLSPRDGSKGLYYKPDAFTNLDLNSDNAYKLTTSIYCTGDILKSSKPKLEKSGSRKKL